MVVPGSSSCVPTSFTSHDGTTERKVRENQNSAAVDTWLVPLLEALDRQLVQPSLQPTMDEPLEVTNMRLHTAALRRVLL